MSMRERRRGHLFWVQQLEDGGGIIVWLQWLRDALWTFGRASGL
jgi:hypothetical protein